MIKCLSDIHLVVNCNKNKSWKLGLEHKLNKICCYKNGLKSATQSDNNLGLIARTKTILRNGQYLNKFYVYNNLCMSRWKQWKRDRERACGSSTTEVRPSMFQLLPYPYTLTHARELGLEDKGDYSMDKGSAIHMKKDWVLEL